MKLNIVRFSVENFRNYVSKVEYQLGTGLNQFSGDNGAGKTSLLSAITWCLFGYDLYGKNVQHFGIYPVIDGVEDTKLVPTVEVEFNNRIVLKRTFAKDRTKCFIGTYDGMNALNFTAYTNKEFDKYIAKELVDPETWELLSNLEKLPRMDWKELKELILGLLGGVEDDVIFANGDYSLVEQEIRVHGADTTHANLKQTKLSIKKDIEAKQAVINSNVSLKEEILKDTNLEELQAAKEQTLVKIQGYNGKIKESEEARNLIAAHEQSVQGVEIRINRIDSDITSKTSEVATYKDFYKNSAFDAEKLRAKDIAAIEQNITLINGKINTANMSIKTYGEAVVGYEESIKKYESQIEDYKTKGKTLQAEEIKLETDNCSLCGQPLPEDQRSAQLTKLKAKREQELQSIMNNINAVRSNIATAESNIESKNAAIEELKASVKTHEESIKKLEADKAEVANKEYAAVNETEQQITYREQYEKLGKEIEQLKADKEAANNELAELKAKELPAVEEVTIPEELVAENERLAVEIDRVTNYDSVIVNNTGAIETLTENLNNNNLKLQQVVRFKAAKSELITQRIGSAFSMVEFITSEITKDGTEKETFKLSYKNIEFSDLSTGQKIRVALDLVTGVQRLKTVQIPILIDNLESVNTRDFIPETQIIAAVRIEQDKPLIIASTDDKVVEHVSVVETVVVDGKELETFDSKESDEESEPKQLPGQASIDWDKL